jgi:hypothetical protein
MFHSSVRPDFSRNSHVFEVKRDGFGPRQPLETSSQDRKRDLQLGRSLDAIFRRDVGLRVGDPRCSVLGMRLDMRFERLDPFSSDVDCIMGIVICGYVYILCLCRAARSRVDTYETC